jgi:hypothetical protein
MVLTWEDIHDIIHAIKFYRSFVVSKFPPNKGRDDALSTTYTWQQRFQAVLESLQPETSTET